jgi:hypothetical protein
MEWNVKLVCLVKSFNFFAFDINNRIYAVIACEQMKVVEC